MDRNSRIDLKIKLKIGYGKICLSFLLFCGIFTGNVFADDIHEKIPLGEKTTHGFRRISSEYIGAIKSEAVLMEHERTGAQVLYVSNGDDEKAFSVGFRTPAEDDTGVNHIIEHTLLNGSKRFPSRQIFVHMLNNSMSTFLNAMTSRDFTYYVFSSRNERDYQNLMRVYMDGVFFPNVLKDENIFRQEGWRYGLTPENNLKYNGVVYNEMRGVYSNYEAYLVNAIQESLYPDTAYSYDSGGKPEAITNLSYERLKEIYQKNYQPSNALIFLYGKQDIDASLKLLNDEYLSRLPELTAQEDKIDHRARIAGDFGGGGEIEAVYPVAADSKDGKSYMAINYSLCQAGDVKSDCELMFVSSLLASGGNSPVDKAIRALGVCENVYAQYDNDMNSSTLSIILEGVDLSKKDLIVKTVRRIMEHSFKNGFEKEQINALSSKMEFANRNLSNLPNMGVKLSGKAIHCFTYGEDVLKEFKARVSFGNSAGLIGNDRIKELIGEYFLENDQNSVVILKPEQGGLERMAPTVMAATHEEQLKAVDFSKWQAASAENINTETMPRLALNEIGEKPAEPDYFTLESEGIKYSFTKAETNGIVGISYYFDASKLPQDKICYANLFADMTGTHLSVGGLSREELRARLNLYVGDFYSYLDPNAEFSDGDVFSPKYVVGIKTLEKNFASAVELLNTIVLDTRIDKKEYVREFIVKRLNAMELSLHEDAPKYAAKAAVSKSGRYEEEIWGYGYYEFLSEMLLGIDDNWEEISRSLNETKELMLNKNDLLFSVTGSGSNYRKFIETTGNFVEKLNSEALSVVNYSFPAGKNKTAFVLPTANVNYVYQSGNYKKTGGEFNGAMFVAAGILNFDYLWPKIRDEGGAYGSRINISTDGTVILRSYRDPNLRETLNVYSGAAQFLSRLVKPGKDIEGVIVNRMAAFDEFYRMENFWDYGAKVHFGTVKPEKLEKIRGEILSADLRKINEFADLLAATLTEEIYSVSGNAAEIAAEKELFEDILYEAYPKKTSRSPKKGGNGLFFS